MYVIYEILIKKKKFLIPASHKFLNYILFIKYLVIFLNHIW